MTTFTCNKIDISFEATEAYWVMEFIAKGSGNFYRGVVFLELELHPFDDFSEPTIKVYTRVFGNSNIYPVFWEEHKLHSGDFF